jgi:uncharacterized protein YciI
MFVITLTYKKPIDMVDQYLAEHRSYLDTCYKNNYFIASGPQHPRTGGILLSQLKDRHQLDMIIQQDPFTLHDIADYTVIEFEPVKYHPAFSSFV